MSCCKYNRQEILQKAREKYSKGKAVQYYLQNKEVIKWSQKIDTKVCQKNKKIRLKSSLKKDISNSFSTKKKHYKINEFCFCSI